MTDISSPYTAWLHALPPWTQEPVFLSFAPCFVVLALLTIRHRIKLHRRGERFTRSKTKPRELAVLFLVGGALVAFRDKFPLIRLVLDWPDRFPYYHAHAGAMWAGFFVASMAAQMVSALFAALFLRGSGGGSRRGVGLGIRVSTHDMLPDPPPGFGWYSKPGNRERIIRTRTYTED